MYSLPRSRYFGSSRKMKRIVTQYILVSCSVSLASPDMRITRTRLSFWKYSNTGARASSSSSKNQTLTLARVMAVYRNLNSELRTLCLSGSNSRGRDVISRSHSEHPLSNEECLHILEQCAKGKCPGSDGLSVEFYLRFWSMLGEELVQSLNYGFEHQHLNITQKQGIIKVIPKKRKDKLYLENWRPLTLLNVDYKIATKAIAHRISNVLPKIINDDQTGYVKERYIGQNIRLIMDIMKVTELENIPGLAIFIDFKKAFDTVDWNFLHKTLQAFNFGPCIQKWIKTFYTDCSSCFINNGYASDFFMPERGVRQGCPLSGILFVLCAEILANAIRTDKTIQGINIHNKEFKLSQYADDTTAFVSDLKSANNLFQLLSNFQECSGLEINKSKTEVKSFWSHFTNWWNFKNSEPITLDENMIIYGVANDFSRRLGLNLCLIIAKHYIYTASRKEEEYYWEAFMAVLESKIQIEMHKSKKQIQL
ncbi:hypothetical protein ACROYT_G044340 [Oculina patagonica]